MPAHAKFTRRRERRLLTLIGAGASISEACRAAQLSRDTVYAHARSDAAFAVRLKAARAGRVHARVQDRSQPDDWRASARMLETEFPENWRLPELPDPDPFDFDGAA